MNAMKFAELGSTGAALMSVFHQWFAGNTGSGGAIGAPCTGNVGGHCCACAAYAAAHNPSDNAIFRARISDPFP